MLKDLNKDAHQGLAFNEFYEIMQKIIYKEIAVTTTNQALSNSHQTLNFNHNIGGVLSQKNFSNMLKKSITIKRQ